MCGAVCLGPDCRRLQSESSTIMSLSRCCQLVILAALAGPLGCKHIGPRTILDDRIPYNTAIAATWKQQTLLNIVRLRYMDIPEFVDVPSIVNGYEHGRSATVGVGGELYPDDSVATFLSPELRGTRSLVDRPTITYAPQTGSEFTRNLTNPIPPMSILNLIESGMPADVVMELAVDSINGIRNRRYHGDELQEADPEFHQVIQIMGKAQASGYVSLHVVPDADAASADVLMDFCDDDVPPSLAADLDRMREILGLERGTREFKVVFGTLPKGKDEIAFRTRSVLKVLMYLALHVQVPECHLVEGRAPDLGVSGPPAGTQFTVSSGCEEPCDAFAAVCYQNHWFWIDQRDFQSKRTMAYLKILLALADTKQKEAAPALTIRAN